MAAGFSRRFGSDKRLARLPSGETLLSATLTLAQRHFADTRVVIRARDDIQTLGLPKDQTIIRAPEKDIGLGTSLGIAFGQLLHQPTEAQSAAVMLGDMPWITDASLKTLIQAAEEGLILRPQFEGQTGHPVIFGRAFWRELASLRGTRGAASLINVHPEANCILEVNDEQILRDVDKPRDLSM